MQRRLFLGAAAAAASPAAFADFRVEISGVGATQIPIAIAGFRDEDRAGQKVSAIIRADLERSGLFRGIDAPGAFDENSPPSLPALRSSNADAFVAGSATRLADGRVDVRFQLWDVVKGTSLGGQSAAVQASDLRLAAHRVADYIYERLTGDKGVFSTRIAYVTKGAGRYALRVADADGESGQVAVSSPEPLISPAWSADGRELAYVSFESRKAVVVVQDVSTGKRRVLAAFRGSNSAPAWAPDGQTLAVTLSREGGSQIYAMNRNGEGLRRLTNSSAIDTEAVYSHDGQLIYFVSDRGGGPQIYRMPAAGGDGERVTFNGTYNISPDLSPDGKKLAYIARQGNTFRVAVLDLAAGGPPQTITDTSDDESPSFAPNGRLLIYATRSQGQEVLMTSTLDGKIKAKLLSSGAQVREPAWGPFGR